MAGKELTPQPSDAGDDRAECVAGQVADQNPWYVGSHFAWAEQQSVRRIYSRRDEFLRGAVARTQQRCGTPLRALDVGCGDGYWLWRLGSLAGVQWTGIDYNPLRIERARRAAPAAMLHCGQLAELGACEPFHFVLLNQVIEHVADDAALLRQIAGLVHRQGTLALGAPNEGSLLQRVGARLRRGGPPTDHVHFYTEPVIRGRIEAAGFVIERVLHEVFYVGFDPLYYWLAARGWGFRVLERLAQMFPSQASDYYFECRKGGD